MNRNYLIPLCLVTLVSCGGQAEPVSDAASHAQEVLEWRAGRLAALKAPDGYLNQTGLYWLGEGTFRFGAAADNDVVFPGDGEQYIGAFDVSANGVHMTIEAGVDVRVGDQPVNDILIAPDTAKEPVTVTHGALAWSVVERDGKFAVRLRDFEHPFVSAFGPLPYFDIDTALRVPARLDPYEEPRVANVGTVIEGLGYHPMSPGLVEFHIDGQSYKLEAYTSDDKLFFVFGDTTNRDDTYGAGRFLYAAVPDESGVTYMDFNKSYSPPCAFNDFSTCPVASPRNRLPIRIEAGEKYDPALHYSVDAGH